MATARRRPPEGDSSAKDSKAGRRGKRGRTRPRRQDRGAFYTAEKNMLEFGLFAVEHEISGVSDLVSTQENVVAVAQLVESRIVIPVVVGSSPISHPKEFLYITGT